MTCARLPLALVAAVVAAIPATHAAAENSSCIVVTPDAAAIVACTASHDKCVFESLLATTEAAQATAVAKHEATRKAETAAKEAQAKAETAAKEAQAQAKAETAAKKAQANANTANVTTDAKTELQKKAQEAQTAAADAKTAEAAANDQVSKDLIDLPQLWAPLDACKKLKLRDAVAAVLPKQLAQFDSDLDLARRTASSTLCSDPDVVCLNTNGTSFNGKGNPKGGGRARFSIAEGEKLTVKVLSLDTTDSDHYQVLLTTMHNLDSLTQTSRAGAGGDKTIVAYTVVASATSSAAGEKDVAIGYELQYRASKDAAYTDVSTGRVTVDHGTYYFEFGFGLPIVYHGTRKATAPTQISESTEPRAAIAVLYFPWGRHKNQIDYHNRLLSSVGVIAGTDFDFTTVNKDLHLGLAYSPIQGLGVALGLSLVPAQFLASPTMATTDGTISTASHEVLRPYVGFFLTTDFLDTAKQAKTALTSLAK